MDRGAGLVDFLAGERRVHQEHQARFAQLPGNRQALGRAETGLVKGFLQVDLGAGTLVARHAELVDFLDNPVTAPAIGELLRTHVGIALVMRMRQLLRQRGYPHHLVQAAGVPDRHGVGGAGLGPRSHPRQLDAADRRLHFEHAPVGAEAFVQPAETRRVLALVHGLIALAVVLERPHRAPQRFVVRRDHATLAARGHDLVLAEAPGARMADGAEHAALVHGAMGLGTVLDDPQSMPVGQVHDRPHVAGPARQVDADDGLRARRQDGRDRAGRNIAAIGLDVSEHRRRTSVHDAGNAGDEGARRNHDFVARTDAHGFQGDVEGQRAVGECHGMGGAAPGSEFLFELAGFGAGPVVDFVRQQDLLDCGCFLGGEAGPRGKMSIQHLTTIFQFKLALVELGYQ